MDANVIDRLAQARVIVVGDVLLDLFVQGAVARVSPEAPVPVLDHALQRMRLGGAANVAANLLVYGASVTLIGVVGADQAAEQIRELCGTFDRLEYRLIEDSKRPTTVKTRYLSGWQQLLRVDNEVTDDLTNAIADGVLTATTDALAGSDAVVLSDYAKGVLGPPTIRRIIDSARQAGVPVIVDPKKTDAAGFSGATVFKPNALELERFAGFAIDSDQAAEVACRRILDSVDIDAILVTRGSSGMTLMQRDREALHVAAEARRVFDVSGAGDTAVATLAAAMATALPIADAVRVANAASGVAVGKPGTATVDPRELKRALGAEAAANVVNRPDISRHIKGWRDQGLVVGFTNGCFDLLHRGHLYSLEQAARRVDRLVVGVNGDASAARLKGPGRPVQDLETRAAVLAALRFVDVVVPFDEDTPAELIAEVQPDVLFKGRDYAGQEVVGADTVTARGGRVQLIPVLEGYSTTGTLKRIRAGETSA
ncbi:MAG: bifunctional heptose 7-phosphate kinase/heptose 1-phosphate adenyltransferase [Hyphomicrobiales bacterium]|nr:bifunctional heptose 7-phosphate kinase/heptose 1-phosphate adenyltransferase [Hyphomicrobiales bacterium]